MLYSLIAAELVLAPHQNHFPPASCNGLHSTGTLLACSFISCTAIASKSLIVALYSAVFATMALVTSKSVQLVQNVLVLSCPPKGENQCQKNMTIPSPLVSLRYQLIALLVVPSSQGCQLYQGLWGEQFCMSKPLTMGFSPVLDTKSSQLKVVCPENTYLSQLSISFWQSLSAQGEALGLIGLSKEVATTARQKMSSSIFMSNKIQIDPMAIVMIIHN